VIFSLASLIYHKLKIDDPCDSSTMSLFCGMWGIIATGIFNNTDGLISSNSDKYSFLKWQVIGLICIIAWSVGNSFIYFFIIKKLGWLRVEPAVEILGLDRCYFTGLNSKDLKMMHKFQRKSAKISKEYSHKT